MNPKKTPLLNDPPVDELTYEQANRALEEIIQKLESDGLTLEDSMAAFERGQRLVKRCSELLDQAELKVKMLTDGQLLDFESEID